MLLPQEHQWFDTVCLATAMHKLANLRGAPNLHAQIVQAPEFFRLKQLIRECRLYRPPAAAPAGPAVHCDLTGRSLPHLELPAPLNPAPLLTASTLACRSGAAARVHGAQHRQHAVVAGQDQPPPGWAPLPAACKLAVCWMGGVAVLCSGWH